MIFFVGFFLIVFFIALNACSFIGRVRSLKGGTEIFKIPNEKMAVQAFAT